MLVAEEQPPGTKFFVGALKISSDLHEIAEHVQQLIEAGFLVGAVHTYGREMRPNMIIDRIKPSGHDFLQAMREDTISKKVKEKVMIPAGSWTLQLAVEYAKNLLRERLGLP